MIKGKRVIAVIPARAGSKSIPNKNVREIAGKPLISWSIKIAQASKYIDRVIVSTDGEIIGKIAQKNGAEVIDRPESLAGDNSLVIDSIRDIIKKIRVAGENAEYMLLLEPTSPLRTVEDVDGVIELISSGKYDSVATFRDAELNPHRAWKIENGYVKVFVDGAIPWLPRQQQPEAWQLNGAVYAFDIDKLPEEGVSLLFGRIGAVTMPVDRSLDIDNIVQFSIAEALLKDIHND